MNLEIVWDKFSYKAGLTLKNHFWDPNYDVANETINLQRKQMSSKYDFSINAVYKINC